MDHDELRHHLDAVTAPPKPGTRSVATRIAAICWPGGVRDRSDRAALQWLRRWRPEKMGTALPVCSCATGRCVLCN